MSRVVGIIPVRYTSTRFPGKPLAEILGKPMVQWVYERCSGLFDELYIATDDRRIKEAAEKFGAEVIMTSSSHTSGTDRCLEAYETLVADSGKDFDILVNIQGDEPLIQPGQIRELISCFEQPGTEIATLIRLMDSADDPENPGIVKVIADKNQKALYFSRAPIPYIREKNEPTAIQYFSHIGMYAYRTSILKALCSLSPSPLEKAEKLEQLRWLENGYTIHIKQTHFNSLGVDTPDDLEKVIESLKKL